MDANRAAIIDIAGELLARREQDQPTILLCQCVRHRIGRGGVVHVEQHRGCILANTVRLCPPVAGADTVAGKIIGPPLVRAGGDNHGVGLDGQHVIRGCGLAGLDFHACALRLPLHPSEQRSVFFLAGQARLPSKLAAKPLRRAEQSYVMTALGRDARRLQAGRACSDDGDAAACRRARGTPRRFTLAAKLRIKRFGERPADMNFAPGEIVEAGRPDVIGLAVARFGGPVGIRDQRPRHADKIAGAFGKGRFSLCRRCDAADRHDGAAGARKPHLFVNVEEMTAPEMHVRRMVFQAQGEVALAVGEIVKRT